MWIGWGFGSVVEFFGEMLWPIGVWIRACIVFYVLGARCEKIEEFRGRFLFDS